MPVDADTVLRLWEQAGPLDDPGRATALAGAVAPVADPDEVADWPLGRRDARLLRLRAAVAGPALEAVTTCPACDGELSFTLDTIALAAVDGDAERSDEPLDESLSVRVDDWQVTCRRLTTADLVAAGTAGTQTDAEKVLLDRATTAIDPPPDTAPHPLPAGVRRAVSDALAAADPLAEVLVDLACPDCDASVAASLDVAAFAWDAVDARAHRLLHDVDVLARVYGWTEAEVLALGDRRRAAYLDLARGETA
jgi:hypothetical protein